MKDRIITNNIRNIKKSFMRFLSLLVMGALGVFAFAGLMAVAPDMINSLDHFLDEHKTYDIKIISDMALDEADVSFIEARPGIEKAEGVCYRDCPVVTHADEGIVNISSLPEDINLIVLTSGHLPEEKNEIVVEESFLKQNKVDIGDTIFIDDEEGFYETEVIISGTVRSPLFYNSVNISNDRGITNVGSGIINYYAYAPRSNFKADYLSIIYATVEGARELTTGSAEYTKLMEDIVSDLESIRQEREKSRYDSIMRTAEDKIDEGSKDAKAALEDAAGELEAARLELDEAAKKIKEGELSLEDIKRELDVAAAKLEEAKAALSDKEKEYEEGKRLFDEAGLELGSKEAQLKEAKALLVQAKATLDEKQAELEEGRLKLSEGKALLDEKQRQADEGAALIASGKKELENASAQLDEARKKADAGKAELDAARKQIKEGEAELKKGEVELAQGKKSLDEVKESLEYIKNEQQRLISSEHLTEDIINSEMERLKSDIDELKGIFEKLITLYREGSLTKENARAVVEEALSSYTREPTVLERIIFYRVAYSYIEPLVNEAQEKYDQGVQELDAARKQLDDGKKRLEEGSAEYAEGLKAISEGEEKYLAGKRELEDKSKELEAGLNQLKEAFAEYEQGLKTLNEAEALLKSGLEEYEAKAGELLEGGALLESAKQEYLEKASELSEGRELLDSARAQIEEGQKQFEEGRAAYEAGKAELEAGKAQYSDGYSKYRSGLAEYESARANFDEEIRKLRLGLSDIGTPTWYIYDRTGYQTYADFFDDAESIRNLSRVFPIVFFMVAVLVSLISMSRMVEMDRLEIGTLKSMGYSREKVITKYAFFSMLATTIGSIIGAVAGLIILPTMIFNIYGILFDIPKFYLSPNWPATLIGFFAVFIFVVGAGMLKAMQVMREKPADLLRPKAPKPGKRVIFEKITPLWKRVRFSDKITIRNLFRYKRRLFVTIFGITGCTSLMLCGFGLKDAIVDIPSKQFDEVFNFNASAFLTGIDDTKRDYERVSRIFDEEEITSVTESMRIKAECEGIETNIVAVEDADDLKDTLKLTDYKTGAVLDIEKGKAVITDKLSRMTGLKEGDEILLTDINHTEHKYIISGIAKNYFEHYVAVEKETLEGFTDYAPNMIYLKTRELTGEEQEDLTKRLLENPVVLNVTFKEKLIENADNMLKSLDKVVVILIILSAALSFVVLYNLSNININERRREIATLKVLGFYDKEVDGYINRENIIVTVIGIAAGLLIGIVLTRIVVGTVEIEKASFINRIKPLSYVYAAGMSYLFTFIVNRITHFNLKKINMIDSLKSVE